ncbi:MAG: hypothetical protein H6744_19685 [Deltaproteobacteria bacterium]|nr:hypothetical protein [Deltaproteobacteria bacterium]
MTWRIVFVSLALLGFVLVSGCEQDTVDASDTAADTEISSDLPETGTRMRAPR